MSKEYNGHRNWNAWNVALWIGNDEGLYNYAQACINRAERLYKNPYNIAVKATKVFLNGGYRGERTPDGALYSFKSVREALEGLME